MASEARLDCKHWCCIDFVGRFLYEAQKASEMIMVLLVLALSGWTQILVHCLWAGELGELYLFCPYRAPQSIMEDSFEGIFLSKPLVVCSPV